MVFLCIGSASAQQQGAAAMQPVELPKEPAATQPSPDDVMRELLLDRRETPVLPAGQLQATPLQPVEAGAGGPQTYETPRLPSHNLTFDPAVLGTAPGAEQPQLRREGEFVFNRHGRLMRTEDGLQVFLFDADSQHAPEPPMVLQPCRLLQSMEDIVQQRGDTVVFVLSGQVHVYRGANYLMPTLMRIAIDRGNLE